MCNLWPELDLVWELSDKETNSEQKAAILNVFLMAEFWHLLVAFNRKATSICGTIWKSVSDSKACLKLDCNTSTYQHIWFLSGLFVFTAVTQCMLQCYFTIFLTVSGAAITELLSENTQPPQRIVAQQIRTGRCCRCERQSESWRINSAAVPWGLSLSVWCVIGPGCSADVPQRLRRAVAMRDWWRWWEGGVVHLGEQN